MHFTTRELESLCDTLVRRKNYFMAAVCVAALGETYLCGLPLSSEQEAVIAALTESSALEMVKDYCWHKMG